MTILGILYLLVALLGATATVRYDGNVVLRIWPKNTAHLDFLLTEFDDIKYDIWKPATGVGSPFDLQVVPEERVEIENILRNHAIPFTVMVEDVQTLIDRQLSVPSRPGSKELDWDTYHTVQEIYDWMDDVAGRCGEECDIFSIGTSEQGWDLKGMKISRSGNTRAVWIDGAIHAREWITPALATYLISRLIFDSDDTTTQLRNTYEFHIQPIVNPDGYDYTWNTDRMWRKTRGVNDGSSCMGTDGNRNFDYQWDLGIGASDNPCSDSFRGSGAFSASETRSIGDYIMPIHQDFIFLFSMHSYGQIVVTPWGYTAEPPEDIDDINEVAIEFVDAAFEVHGTEYTYRPPGGMSGSTMDWGKGAALIKYSYILESRDTGAFGFLLPPELILPTCEETWAGVQAMMVRIDDKEPL